jgi:hypothetical protein
VSQKIGVSEQRTDCDERITARGLEYRHGKIDAVVRLGASFFFRNIESELLGHEISFRNVIRVNEFVPILFSLIRESSGVVRSPVPLRMARHLIFGDAALAVDGVDVEVARGFDLEPEIDVPWRHVKIPGSALFRRQGKEVTVSENVVAGRFARDRS